MNKLKSFLYVLKRHPKKTILLTFLLLFTLYIISGLLNHLETTNYTYTSSKLPKDFDNYKIVQISDLHTKFFGTDNCDLIDAVKDCSPDLIAITGDLINDDINDIEKLTVTLQQLSAICPTYFVCGNHDMPSWDDYVTMVDKLSALGVTTIDNQKTVITKGDSCIYLSGLFSYNESYSVEIDPDEFNILLYHYANHFESISLLNYDLILAGHTHGGIIRLPILGGLIGTDGKLFPKYDDGMYTSGSSTLISSRGLGKAIVPRFNNNPELVCITLQCK